MNKKVNIFAPFPVKTIRPMIEGTVKGAIIPIGDIHKLLCGKAQVFEILNDGRELQLNFANYNKINDINTKVKATIDTKKSNESEKHKTTIMNTPILNKNKKNNISSTEVVKEVIPAVVETVVTEDTAPVVEETKPVTETVTTEDTAPVVEEEKETTKYTENKKNNKKK